MDDRVCLCDSKITQVKRDQSNHDDKTHPVPTHAETITKTWHFDQLELSHHSHLTSMFTILIQQNKHKLSSICNLVFVKTNQCHMIPT